MTTSNEHNTTATRVLVVNGRPIRRIRRYALLSDAGTTHEFEQRVVRVGSRSGNDLRIEDPAVSRLHFEIIADTLGFRVRDLSSRNGTWLDGFRVMDAYLTDGCVVRVGNTSLQFSISEEEADVPASVADGFGPLVGESLPMRELYAALEEVAGTDLSVLVQGENGTGKELVARAIHQGSARAGGAFVVVDCAAVTTNELQSELFGHEAGAFPGAQEPRMGLLEEADGGTLFIDELGDVPIELQSRLLRALDRGELRRIGATFDTKIDVRVVAATTHDLAREVNEGRFREELFYQLSATRVRVPPLRERQMDVRLLAEHFVRRVLRKDPERADAILQGIDDENWERLNDHPWPGNVRQLRNVIERTVMLSGKGNARIALPTASVDVRGALTPPSAVVVDLDRPFGPQKSDVVADFERHYLEGQMARHDGNFTRAAAAAGLDRMYFKRLLKKYR